MNFTPYPYGKKHEECHEILYHLVAEGEAIPVLPRNDRPFDMDDPEGWRDSAQHLPHHTSLYQTAREIDPLTLAPMTEWSEPKLVAKREAPQEEMELA